MQITHTHHFDASVEDVMSMLADQEFAHARGATGDAEDGDVSVTGTADGAFSVAIRRTIPSTTIPQEFRSFVGSSLTVKYTEAWQEPAGDHRHATFAVEIMGAPGHASGRLSVTPEGDGSVFAVDGTVNVKVPLFGAMIAQAVSKAVLRGLEAELAEADAWLAAR
ncbi:DUF2505 domain-containing protein [Demequina sp. NBRC 110057]|uniref:DUF2505 domain-containing protein n=1 Tax=Demequina sp. NBRC 110057 TaxID=1570346 RepID=UPI000A07190C|nr:DUF2505 domain-containing protein [Demequina sp. NBRC 110057]